jgi:hypothetical protein
VHAPPSPTRSAHGASVGAALVAWTAVAALAVHAGALRPVPMPLLVPPLTATLLGALWLVPTLRAWAGTLPLRALVGLHLSRVVGVAFLVLAARGALSADFAVPAAAGDIAAAVGAGLVMAFCVPPVTLARRRALLAWNALGLADMLFVVVTAARLTRVDPAAMAPLGRLPLALLPLVLVPLIVASHVVLFARLKQQMMLA